MGGWVRADDRDVIESRHGMVCGVNPPQDGRETRRDTRSVDRRRAIEGGRGAGTGGRAGGQGGGVQVGYAD